MVCELPLIKKIYTVSNDKAVLTKDLEGKNVICNCILHKNYKIQCSKYWKF